MPAETGSPIARNTIGIALVARLAARIPAGPRGDDDVHPGFDEFGCEREHRAGVGRGPTHIGDGAAFDIAEIAHTLNEAIVYSGRAGSVDENSNDRRRLLLRPRSERQGGRATHES
jgi:hypothetical protein